MSFIKALAIFVCYSLAQEGFVTVMHSYVIVIWDRMEEHYIQLLLCTVV